MSRVWTWTCCLLWWPLATGGRRAKIKLKVPCDSHTSPISSTRLPRGTVQRTLSPPQEGLPGSAGRTPRASSGTGRGPGRVGEPLTQASLSLGVWLFRKSATGRPPVRKEKGQDSDDPPRRGDGVPRRPSSQTLPGARTARWVPSPADASKWETSLCALGPRRGSGDFQGKGRVRPGRCPFASSAVADSRCFLRRVRKRRAVARAALCISFVFLVASSKEDRKRLCTKNFERCVHGSCMAVPVT